MASWGLAFEYGKNAYMDMMKKQEELDRYLAERSLWETELRTKEAAANANRAETERVAENSIILSQYADEIMSGNYSAYADALSKINPNKQYRHLGDGVIAEIDPKNPKLTIASSARSIKGIEPTALISELYKSAESTGAISSNERKSKEEELKHKRAKELKKMEGDNAARVATINKQGAIAAAAAKASSGVPGRSKVSRINLSDKDREYLDSTVAQTLFGSGARGIRTEDGGWEVYDKTGAPVALKEQDMKDLEEVHRVLLTDSSNLAQTNMGDLQANIASVASILSNQIKRTKDYNTAWKKYEEDTATYKKAQDAAKKASKEVIKFDDIDLTYLPDISREAVEEHLNRQGNVISTAKGMPDVVWDTKTYGERGDSLRPITYNLGLKYITPSEERASNN